MDGFRPDFVPGLDLGRRFYRDVVRPLLDRHVPWFVHSAALLGNGSEVLGFDTEMSTDHDWGPRVLLFPRAGDAARAPAVLDAVGSRLPSAFAGFPLGDQAVGVVTVPDFVRSVLAWDATRPLTPADWLSFPGQALLSLTAGAVHHDGTGELGPLRERLAWYPRDVWLYLLAAGWQRIAQEEHLMPRAGFVGDELGSALIGSRLVRDVMSLCFLMERRYAPYPKWFGTAFARLACGPALAPALRRAQLAAGWRERGAALCEAYETLARMHNALRLTEELPADVSPFFDRPFRVIHGERFAGALRGRIADPAVRALAERHLVGGIDQLSDSTDLRAGADWLETLRPLYR